MASLRVLLVEDDENWQNILRDRIVRAFREISRATDSEVRVVADFNEAWRALEKDGSWDLLVTDINFDPSDLRQKLGIQLASHAHELRVPTLVVSGTIVLNGTDAQDLLKRYRVVHLFGKNTFDRDKFSKKVKSIVTRPKPPEMEAPPMNYHDFHVLVMGDRRIRASSEQGDEWGNLQLEMNRIQLTMGLIERRQTNIELLKGLGRELYRALFPINIHGRLQATIAGAEGAGGGVRLRLVFESPELAALPWEFLYDEGTNTFLANNTRTALSRYIDVPLQRRELKAASWPLHILLVISSPTSLPTLDSAAEERLIYEALAKHIEAGQIAVDVLHDATIRNLNQKLREKSYNVFHFIGHGVFEHDKGFIALMNQDGTAKLLDDEGFANFFLGNRSLGLAVLNACQGAAVSSHRVFAGMASNLVQRGIPAVVAMQYSILDTTAKLFADEFYRTLALGWPVDAAVQTTRNAISMEVGLGQPDFATPVLYMRAQDGVILSGL